MRRARAIITFASGRRAKWGVVVFWLIIVALAGPLSGKLMGAEKNDASSWLPAKAESTQVVSLQSKIQSPNVFTAVVVYDRPDQRRPGQGGRRPHAVHPGARSGRRAGGGAGRVPRRESRRDPGPGQP